MDLGTGHGIVLPLTGALSQQDALDAHIDDRHQADDQLRSRSWLAARAQDASLIDHKVTQRR